MHIFPSFRRLFRGLRIAAREPAVRGVVTLALALICSASVFYWLVERWSFIDSLYFSVVTIATVGFGDFAPKTTIGKLFTIGYIFAGIGIFVSAVTAVAQAVLHEENKARK